MAAFSVIIESTTPGTIGERAREAIAEDPELFLSNQQQVDFPFGTVEALELERRSSDGLRRAVWVLFADGDLGYSLEFEAPDVEFGDLLGPLGEILRTFDPTG